MGHHHQIPRLYQPATWLNWLTGLSNIRAFGACARLPRSEEFHPTRGKQRQTEIYAAGNVWCREHESAITQEFRK
jgi:hypothetical protein